MHMTVSIVIVQVAVSVVAMHVTVSSSNFKFLSLIPIFHKIDQKTSKGRRHYIKFAFHHLVNILPKLRYFVGRICWGYDPPYQLCLFYFIFFWGGWSGFGGNNYCKQCHIEMKFWPQVVLIVTKMSFKGSWKARIFAENF